MAHKPRKRFGQHFLCDQFIIQRIVAAIQPNVQQHFIEIGPGQGALTFPLLKNVKEMDAVELDRDLIPHLEERGRQYGKLNIFSADALTFDFARLKKDSRPLRVIGNLPYNISTPLIFHLLTFGATISDMVFMLQKEVAQRLAAGPSTEHYGRLSVMVQYHCLVDLLFDVPPSAFYPPPQVDSSIIRLTPLSAPSYPAQNYAVFENIVKQSFSQRRKTLRNNLKKIFDASRWQKLGIDPNLRAENLSVQDFVLMSNEVAKET